MNHKLLSKLLMPKIKFNPQAKFYHMSFEYQVHPYFPELDWLLLNYQINKMMPLYEIEVLSFVMMKTHCHLLLKSNNKKENYFAHELQKKLYPYLVENAEVDKNPLEPITNLSQFLNTYRYIYRNPVEAKICQNCEDYRFSTLHALLGKSEFSVNVIDPLAIIQNPIKILKWLNKSNQNNFFKTTKNQTMQNLN